MISFDADTALEPIGAGRFLGTVPRSWWVEAGPSGGFVVALAARATGLVSPLPPASLTTHFLEAPVEGPIAVSAEVVRQGRSAGFVRIGMEQEGRRVVQAIAVCTAWRDDAFAWNDAVPPALPEPDECVRVDTTRSKVAPVMVNYDMRVAPTEPDARPVVFSGWVRTAERRPADRPLLAAYTDAFLPPAMLRAGFDIRVPTLELTVHFRDRPPEGDHPWVIGTFCSRVAAGGVIEEDGELWSADGRLLAMSRQLSLIR